MRNLLRDHLLTRLDGQDINPLLKLALVALESGNEAYAYYLVNAARYCRTIEDKTTGDQCDIINSALDLPSNTVMVIIHNILFVVCSLYLNVKNKIKGGNQ